jgi:hypothetical protein
LTNPSSFSAVLAIADRLLDQREQTTHPHRRAILDTARDIQRLDEEIDALSEPSPTARPAELRSYLDALSALLIERVAMTVELDVLLDTSCGDEPFSETVDDPDFLSCGPEHPGLMCIVHDCLLVFADCGQPDALPSAELADKLSRLSGRAEDGLPYAGLAPIRLARLLAPYGIHSRNVRFPGGQRKAYDRTLLAATAREGCC